MRTFEEIQNMILNGKTSLMNRSRKQLEAGGLRDYEERAMNMLVRDCQSYIDNIQEVTVIDIGATTNSLINAVRKGYQYHLTDYWQNFERFAEEYIVGLTQDGNFKNGQYFGQGQCYELGIGVQELAACFKGRNPMKSEAGDLFRTLINANYGTNIPMEGVREQALKDWDAVYYQGDQIAKDKAFVKLKELQRDDGFLRNGGDYYLLATNQEYQAAKARLSGKSL